MTFWSEKKISLIFELFEKRSFKKASCIELKALKRHRDEKIS